MKVLTLSVLMAVASMVSSVAITTVKAPSAAPPAFDLSWKGKSDLQLQRLNNAIVNMKNSTLVRYCAFKSDNVTQLYHDCKKGRKPGQVMMMHFNWERVVKTGVTIENDKDLVVLISGALPLNMTGGDLFAFKNCSNVLVRSSATGFGGIQANSYLGSKSHSLVRFTNSINVTVNNMALIDSPRWNILLENVRNAEINNVRIQTRLNKEATDGVAISGTNVYVHDLLVTNGASCVVVRPSTNVLVERVTCNRSKGSGVGTLSNNGRVRQVVFRNIYNIRTETAFLVRPTTAKNAAIEEMLLQNFVVINSTNGFQLLNSPNNLTLYAYRLRLLDWKGNTLSSDAASYVAHCSAGRPCKHLAAYNYDVKGPSGNVTSDCFNVGEAGKTACPISNKKTPRLPWFADKDLFVSITADNVAIPFPKDLPRAFFPNMAPVPARYVISPLPGRSNTNVMSNANATTSSVAAVPTVA